MTSPILAREVLACMTDKIVTVYLTDGNHITGRLSSVIVSDHRDDHDTAQGLHLVDLADGTPHDVAYVYLPHVVAIAPAREQDRRPVARGDEPTPARTTARHVELDDGTGSARFVLDHDVKISIDRTGTRARAVVIEWTANGERCSLDAYAPAGPLELRAKFAGHYAEELSS